MGYQKYSQPRKNNLSFYKCNVANDACTDNGKAKLLLPDGQNKNISLINRFPHFHTTFPHFIVLRVDGRLLHSLDLFYFPSLNVQSDGYYYDRLIPSSLSSE